MISSSAARRLAGATALFSIAFAQPVVAASDDPDARIVRLERWLKAAIRHQPGAKDDALNEVSLWSNVDLRALKLDEDVIARLLHNPAGTIRMNSSRDSRVLPYTAWQTRRLRELADEYQKRNEHDGLLVRGALLHGDIALSSAADSALAPEASGENIRIQTMDGQPLGFGARPIHWEMARQLFDAARPAGDDVARRWYIATSTWMQSREQHDTVHLRHGREMFPDDAQLLFLSGCQQEIYAGPAIQALVRTVALPSGYHVDVDSESASLREAESFFRRAIQRDSQNTEVRIRLSHVLLARARPQDAAAELRNLEVGTLPAVLQYFHAMFLGQAEEALGQFDAAYEAYTRASSLFPGAQSPYLALSAMATHRGNRAAALKDAQRLFELPDRIRAPEDPLWSYRTVHARNADRLLEALYRQFIR